MNLADALDQNQQQNQSAGIWPDAGPSNPMWPGGNQPYGPGGQPQPTNPGGSSFWGNSGPGGQPQPTNPGGSSFWGNSGPGGQPQPNNPGGSSFWGNSGPGGQPQPPNSGGSSFWGTPSGPGGKPSPGPGPGFPVAPQQNLTVPFEDDYPGLQNKLITICGTINRNPVQFAINICSGTDIAYHFNPRFTFGAERVIVQNSCICGEWGTEECELKKERFPFTPGRDFEVVIKVTGDGFEVKANGTMLQNLFKHRILKPLNKIKITCDVTLSKVDVRNA